jgi:hypothetical protein
MSIQNMITKTFGMGTILVSLGGTAFITVNGNRRAVNRNIETIYTIHQDHLSMSKLEPFHRDDDIRWYEKEMQRQTSYLTLSWYQQLVNFPPSPNYDSWEYKRFQ